MNEVNERNRLYYASQTEGLESYWKEMAAPVVRRETFMKLIAEHRPSSVVDLGCGGGHLLYEIRQRWPQMQLAGVELSDEQIERNRQRSPEIHWMNANLDAPAAFSHQYECVIASEIIEHVSNPGVFLENAYRLAKPGALLLLSTQSGRVQRTERLVGHFRHYSAPEMTQLLLHSGWTPLKVWNTGFPFQDLSKRVANLRPELSVQHFANRKYGWPQKLVCFLLRLLFRLNSQTRGTQLYAVARR